MEADSETNRTALNSESDDVVSSGNDDSLAPDKRFVDARFIGEVRGGDDTNGDGHGDLVFRPVAGGIFDHVPERFKPGWMTRVNFRNIGKKSASFFVKVVDVPKGWRIWAADGGWRPRDWKHDVDNVSPEAVGSTAWAIAVASDAPSPVNMRFRLYHDGILPSAAPLLGNDYLDEIVVTLRRGAVIKTGE